VCQVDTRVSNTRHVRTNREWTLDIRWPAHFRLSSLNPYCVLFQIQDRHEQIKNL